MSREIKFRAICKRTGKFVYGLPSSMKAINLENNVRLSIKEGTIKQFTGLTDINGKEIYEDDVLNVHIFTQELGGNLGVTEGEKTFKAQICYKPLGLWLQGNTEEESDYIVMFNGIHEESFEIIGNIYENRELL